MSTRPTCPGSLYERCTERRGHIIGLPNWRLSRLQEGIRARSLPSMRELTRLTGSSFYAGDYDLHYAQARYLLYALQEKGLLLAYYRAFVSHLKSDRTGYAALLQVLGAEDMAGSSVASQRTC